MKLIRRTAGFVAALVTLAAPACERSKTASPDSAAVRPASAADSASAARAPVWDASAGPILLIEADSPDRAFVIVPDSTASAAIAKIPKPASVTLFGRSGSIQTAELPSLADSGSCTIAALSAAPPPHPWSVGFIGGVVSPLPMDSTESISRADSANLVVWINRLASALPNDSAGRFEGLAFVVHGLWRFTLPTGAQVVVANIARQINQEATPLQEHTFLMAERAAGDSTFVTAYSERSYGAEETVESHDVLAAALLGSNRNVALVVGRDYGDSNAYALIERGDDGQWRARWSSPRRHCT
jgi:hypothetical protein